jgi:type I restriction enzyme S subunit
MGTENKSPEVRFAGFTEDWETGILKELTDIYDGTHQTPSYKEKGVMFLSVENIKNLKSNKFISEQDFENDFKVFPEKGDILMTRIGDVGTPNIVEEEAKIAYYVTLALLKKKELNPYFLKEVILSKNVQKEIWHRTLHIAFPKKINKNEIEKVRISYPKSQDEQKKIGYIFRNINRLIENHQTQLTKLKNLKKAMLTKMFPQNGASVPEIRFKGFDEEWEEKALGNFTRITTGVSNREDSGLDGEFTFFDRSEDIRRSDIFLFDCEAIIVAGEGSDFAPKYFKGKFDLHQRTYAIMDFQDSDSMFVFYYIHLFRNYFLDVAVGSTVKSLRLPMFQDMTVIMPKKDEQEKIGIYFKKLDTLILNHNEQLKKLNNIKKACLNKLFLA